MTQDSNGLPAALHADSQQQFTKEYNIDATFCGTYLLH
jgi:hypothetical protein